MNIESRLRDFGFSLKKTTAFKITIVYILIGAAWIAISDSVLLAFAQNEVWYQQVQTGKGWLFVAFSAIVLYGLMVHRERQLQESNYHLDQAIRQVSILHRVLRHNLKNILNIIAGNVDMLEGLSDQEQLDIIQTHVRELMDLSEKSGYLHKVAMGEHIDRVTADITSISTTVCDDVREKFPQATIHTQFDDAPNVTVLPRFEIVLQELIENAIQHNDASNPTVWVSVTPELNGPVRLDIGDDGPGIPEMEEDVLESGIETPLFHSLGLGLWLARIMVIESGGTVDIIENEPKGSIVRIALQPAET